MEKYNIFYGYNKKNNKYDEYKIDKRRSSNNQESQTQ